MGKYLLLTEIYIFIQSFFLIICSNKDVKNNNESVEFEFLEIENGGKKDNYIVDNIEDNGQILEKDVFVKLTKGDIKGKNLKLITNSFMDYKYDDVEGNVYCNGTDLIYKMNENMFENVNDNIYKIKVREKLNERVFDDFDNTFRKNRYYFQLFIRNSDGEYNPIVNKNNYICLVYCENNYFENLKKQYNDYLNKKNRENIKNDIKKNTDNNIKKNVKNNIKNNSENNIEKENNIVKSDENKELIEKEEINTNNIIIESENNENNQNIENKEKLNDENDKYDKKIEDEIKEIYKEEVKNNEILHYLNKENKNYLNKSDEIKKRSLKNNNFFNKEKELNNKINSNINEKLNNIDNKIKNDEFFNNSSSKKCCKNKKSEKINQKKCCKK